MLAVLFRMLPHYNVRNLNAITINYLTCFTLGSLIIGSSPLTMESVNKDWFSYALYLSFCFIFFFNINALTIQKVGMVITSIFQKLSLVFPVIVGVLLFKENLSVANKIAIPLTIIAIILSNMPDKSQMATVEAFKIFWYLPFLVLFGGGLIEVSLFYAQETGQLGSEGLHFTSALFGLAGLWGLLMLTIKKSLRFNRNELVAGILIGVPNFFTIYLIVLCLDRGWKGAVLFPTNNIGTIFFTAMMAIFVFKERLSLANHLGLILALASVLLFSL